MQGQHFVFNNDEHCRYIQQEATQREKFLGVLVRYQMKSVEVW
jgi:hypothetical protein